VGCEVATRNGLSVCVFSQRSVGVLSLVLLDFLEFWAGLDPLFLTVFLEAFLPFFGHLKNAFCGF
jgi:hypothetical protein